IEKVSGEEVKDALEKSSITLLAGCAPCQPFSSYFKKSSHKDKRWWLLSEFSRLINDVSPDLVTMENVPGLMSQNVFKDFVCDLNNNEYWIDYQVINCMEFGLPQKRNRLVLLASKLGPIKIREELKSKNKITVKSAIGKMKLLNAGDVDCDDILHQCSSLSALNLKRIRASKPDGTWRDWPKELVAKCHTKKSGTTYPSVYGRMSWNKPSPTITTQFFGFGNGRFGHPEQDRALSLREGALLQGFPLNYKFVEPGKSLNKRTVGRLIGNAVPVRLGEVIGNSIQKHVGEYYE
ncbi:MAG: DNA cytosine methyltransferase, partial [Desulfobacteraceae bacterium]